MFWKIKINIYLYLDIAIFLLLSDPLEPITILNGRDNEIESRYWWLGCLGEIHLISKSFLDRELQVLVIPFYLDLYIKYPTYFFLLVMENSLPESCFG